MIIIWLPHVLSETYATDQAARFRFASMAAPCWFEILRRSNMIFVRKKLKAFYDLLKSEENAGEAAN